MTGRDAELMRLHRDPFKLPGDESTSWWIGDLRLGVSREGRRWTIIAPDGDARRWLIEQQLLDAQFRTRSEAVRCALAAHAHDPAPSTSASSVQLRRQPNGTLVDDRHELEVVGDGRRWTVRSAHTRKLVMFGLPSLWHVRSWIAERRRHHAELGPGAAPNDR